MKIIKTHYLYISLTIVLAAITLQFINIHSIQQENNHRIIKQRYNVETFQMGENGWGYNILSGKKIIIKQDIIPAIQQSVPFQSENDARKTAQLVINKLNRKKLPTVTVDDLDNLGIVF